MRQLVIVILSLFLLVTTDAYARRGGGSFRSSRSPSRSTPKPTPAPKKTAPKKSSTLKKKTDTDKAKAVSKNKLDKKQQKMLASKDKAAFKKYPDKKAATADYQKALAKKNSYTSSNPPAERPNNIPQSVSHNGQPTNVTYNVLPGGGYGYGYMDPTTMMFMALAANHYVVDPYEMRNAGYGQWDASGRPVLVRTPRGYIIFWIVLVCVVGVIIVGVLFFRP